MESLSILEKNLGVVFNNKALLEEAITHRSFLNESTTTQKSHNERLEFLGDAVLELVVTEHLFALFPDKPEGELTALRSALVRTESISEAGKMLEVDPHLKMSKGESKDTGKAREYIIANAFEAIVGAVYLDQGYEKAKMLIAKTLFPRIDEITTKQLWRDPKSYVQEKAQEVFRVTPSYQVLSEKGPDHDKTFTVGIMFGNKEISKGIGRSKQAAEQDAAKNAIEKNGWE